MLTGQMMRGDCRLVRRTSRVGSKGLSAPGCVFFLLAIVWYIAIELKYSSMYDYFEEFLS